MDLLKALIILSEKAANIARTIRQNQHLFNLLVERKSLNEANPRFVEDFKTLADVLIQEMVKHYVSQKFPALDGKIFGEENNTFCNKLQETITVEVKDTQKETSELLIHVLNGDREAADLLAEEVHRNVLIEDVDTTIPEEEFTINMETLGIWIDPIDGTSEYINGEDKGIKHGIPVSGLQCVTVLIGAFDQETGKPVVGVVNRPFFKSQDPKCFQCQWGVSTEYHKFSSINKPLESVQNVNKIICISSSEDITIKSKLKSAGYELVETSGAGHKILQTILGMADAYILTKNSTFFWDTCAPQAILNSIDGDIVVYSDAIMQKTKVSLEYAFSQSKNNVGGIIAYRDESVLNHIVDILD